MRRLVQVISGQLLWKRRLKSHDVVDEKVVVRSAAVGADNVGHSHSGQAYSSGPPLPFLFIFLTSHNEILPTPFPFPTSRFAIFRGF